MRYKRGIEVDSDVAGEECPLVRGDPTARLKCVEWELLVVGDRGRGISR